MPMLCRSFLEYMAVVNFAPRTIASRGKDLQAFSSGAKNAIWFVRMRSRNRSSKPISGTFTATGKRTASRLDLPHSKVA